MCPCWRQAAIGAACFSHFATSTCRDQRVSLWGIVVGFWSALPAALTVCFLHKLTDYSPFPTPHQKYRQLKSLEWMLLSVDVRRDSMISKYAIHSFEGAGAVFFSYFFHLPPFRLVPAVKRLGGRWLWSCFRSVAHIFWVLTFRGR